MNFWRSVEGVVKGELTGAEPGDTLYILNQRGIRLDRVEWIGELTVQFQCSRLDCGKITELCRKRGDTVRFFRKMGLFFWAETFLHRPVLLMGMLFILLVTLLLPTRVLFFQVEGNETIPDRQILAVASSCGIRFGVSRREVRSEKMKNALLQAMPELKWAGINTAGCTAVISVREREITGEKTEGKGARSVVAARDGFLTSCTVTRGNLLCSPGQVVQKGQVLISGYTDCGICIRVTEAEGEIYAQTNRDFSAVMPAEYTARTEQLEIVRRFSLLLGKKRINFWKGSGISLATCGRMYKEYHITLPGGFCLPVRLGVETLTSWKTVTMEHSPEQAESGLKTFARRSILEQSVAGRILRENMMVTQQGDRFLLEGTFLCSEMIGRAITEEIGDTNGKNS